MADPVEYAREASAGAVIVTADLLGRFAGYLADPPPPEEPRTGAHIRDVIGYLVVWQTFFRGRDLRRFDLRGLTRELNQHRTARQKRIVALKSLTKWLRVHEGVLSRADDPTADLAVPQATPEQSVRQKGYTI
jgi:hypothetical protein